MKKFLTSALSFAMMLGTLSIAHAQVAETDWSEGITQTGSQIVIPAGLAGGAYSNQFKGDLITSEEKSYEMIIDLNSDYTHGELFSLSLGLGKDADTYTNEYLVMTQKNGDQFTITSGVLRIQSQLLYLNRVYILIHIPFLKQIQVFKRNFQFLN